MSLTEKIQLEIVQIVYSNVPNNSTLMLLIFLVIFALPLWSLFKPMLLYAYNYVSKWHQLFLPSFGAVAYSVTMPQFGTLE